MGAEPERTTNFVDVILGIVSTLASAESLNRTENFTGKNEILEYEGFLSGLGLVGVMFAFAAVAFVLWVISFTLVPEIQGLHLEDIDMYIGDKPRLVAYKREVKQNAASRRPLLAGDVVSSAGNGCDGGSGAVGYGSSRYGDFDCSNHSRGSLDRTRRGEDGEDGEFLDTSMRAGHRGFDDDHYSNGRGRGKSAPSSASRYESRQWNELRASTGVEGPLNRPDNGAERYYDSQSKPPRGIYEGDMGSVREQGEGMTAARRVHSEGSTGVDSESIDTTVPARTEVRSVGRPQPRYAPSMDSAPPPQPFYPHSLNSGKRSSGAPQQAKRSSSVLNFGEFY